MLHLLVFLIGFVGTLSVAERAAPAANAQSHCDAPSELVQDEPKFPALAARFKSKEPVTILVIGGASTAGTGPDNSYPHFLELALRRHHPGAQITVLNRGIPGQTTEQMAARFTRDVFAQKPALVIWETGTVDAVRGQDVNVVADALSGGIAALQERHSEVMLMDMQYNPSTVSVINFQPYLEALHQTAALQDVYMFQRFEMMKYWSEAGAFDFINVPTENKASLAREIYECLGERLADAIDFATH